MSTNEALRKQFLERLNGEAVIRYEQQGALNTRND